MNSVLVRQPREIIGRRLGAAAASEFDAMHGASPVMGRIEARIRNVLSILETHALKLAQVKAPGATEEAAAKKIFEVLYEIIDRVPLKHGHAASAELRKMLEGEEGVRIEDMPEGEVRLLMHALNVELALVNDVAYRLEEVVRAATPDKMLAYLDQILPVQREAEAPGPAGQIVEKQELIPAEEPRRRGLVDMLRPPQQAGEPSGRKESEEKVNDLFRLLKRD